MKVPPTINFERERTAETNEILMRKPRIGNKQTSQTAGAILILTNANGELSQKEQSLRTACPSNIQMEFVLKMYFKKNGLTRTSIPHTGIRYIKIKPIFKEAIIWHYAETRANMQRLRRA